MQPQIQWYQIVSLILTVLVFPTLGIIFKLVIKLITVHEEKVVEQQKRTDDRLTKAEDKVINTEKKASLIEHNYINRFDDVKDNLTGLRADLTLIINEGKFETLKQNSKVSNQLTRIETILSGVPCIADKEECVEKKKRIIRERVG